MESRDAYHCPCNARLQVKFYKRRLLDEKIFPVWRANAQSDMRQHLQERLLRTVLVNSVPSAKDSVSRLSISYEGGIEPADDGLEGDMDLGDENEQLAIQQIAEGDVKTTTRMMEQVD